MPLTAGARVQLFLVMLETIVCINMPESYTRGNIKYGPYRRKAAGVMTNSEFNCVLLVPLSLSAGARRRPELLPRGSPLAAVLSVLTGGLLLGAAAVPHSGLGLPAAVLPAAVPAVVAAVRHGAEPGLRAVRLP